MKMSKQTIQVLILVVLMLFLIIYAVMQPGVLGGSKPADQAKPTANETAKTADDNAADPAGDVKVDRKKGNPADLLWIDTERLAGVVTEVKGGRDPFEDLLIPEKIVLENNAANNPANNAANNPANNPANNAANNPANNPLPSGNGDVSPLPSPDDNISQQVKLFWLTASDLRKLLKIEGFKINQGTNGLRIKAINDNSHTVTLTGLRVDVDDALKIINASDKEPPKPKFRLIGILKTSNKNFVVLAVEGQQYELYEGDTINKLGWSVAAINASGVRLTKGRQTVLLPIGGPPQ